MPPRRNGTSRSRGADRREVFTNWVEFEKVIRNTSVSKGPAGKMQLVGLLFMRKGQKLADGEIVPSLDYFNARSAKTDFVLPGWKYDSESVDQWSFDENVFVTACKVVRENTKWKYSGGTELLLFEAHKGERITQADACPAALPAIAIGVVA
jgi:hypothetical protein